MSAYNYHRLVVERIAAHHDFLKLFASPDRSPQEQLMASEAFEVEVAAVVPDGLSGASRWRWLAKEARAVLEVDGAL